MDLRKPFCDADIQGVLGETQIAHWLRHVKQYRLVPTYEVELATGKGPRVLTPFSELIAPDFLGIKKLDIRWIEAKTKTAFTWHRISGNWQTGIDIRHYEDYRRVQKETELPVCVLFLHRCERPYQRDLLSGSPQTCPTGLFYSTLDYLHRHEHHRDSFTYGKRSFPMVYWNHQDLRQLATLEAFYAALNEYKQEHQ